MSVRVDIPIKVRTDVNAVVNRKSDFERSLSVVIGRAFEKSYEEVARKRGGYVDVIINNPEFNFIGSGAIKLTLRQKLEIQEIIKKNIEQASQASGVLDASVNSTAGLQTGDVRAEERIDENRFMSLLNTYAIPGYDGGGEEEHVEVVPHALIVNHQYYIVDLSYSRIARNAGAALRVLKPLYVTATEEYGPPNTNEAGLLWQSGSNRFTLFIQNMQTEKWRSADINVQQYKVETQGTALNWSQENRVLPALIGAATYHDLSEAETVHRQFHTDYIRDAIERNAIRPETMTREHYRSLVDQAIEFEIQRRTQALTSTPNVAGIIVIDFGIDVFIGAVGISSEYGWQGRATIYPVLQRVEVPADQGQGGDGDTVGDGTGDGNQGRGQGRGGIVAGGGDAGAAGGSLYPVLASQSGSSLRCQPYMGEPVVDELGQVGGYIKGLVQEIATRLQISPCDYAGNFLINAAEAIASRAADIGNYAATNEESQPGFFSIASHDAGNMGVVNFVPNASPAIQFMRFLAGTAPLITRLSHLLDRTYTISEHSAKFAGHAQNNPYFWLLRFHYDLRGKMELGVGTMFIMSCRVLMLQFLLTSKEAITARIRNFQNYAPLFEQLLIGEMADIHELRTLQGRLSRQIADEKGTRNTATEIGQGVMLSWNAATDGISDLFNGYNPIEEDIVDRGFIKRDGKTIGIIDSDGHRWTSEQLETSLAIRQNTAESVDPLVKQIRDIPQILNRFRQNKNAIRSELRTLLNEMLESNNDVRTKVVSDRNFAFEASKIQENIQSASIPGTSFPMQGIHLQTHLKIGEFFRGDTYYALGINALFGRELGIESLKEFFIFTGLTLLAVVCAPLAVAVGAGIAAYEYHKAQERLQVYRALIEPEVVMSQAELEAELFAAELGLALSFIPYAGRILGTGARVGKVVVRQGVRGSARVFTRYSRLSRRQLGRSMTRQQARQVARSIRRRFNQHLIELKEGFVSALIQELIEDQLLDILLQKLVFGPSLERIYSDFRDYTPANATNTGGVLLQNQVVLSRSGSTDVTED